MRSLCTCAALAVATAFAHGHFADALLRSGATSKQGTAIGSTELNKFADVCLQKINEFRSSLNVDAIEYEGIKDISSPVDTTADLSTFLQENTCEALKDGSFKHLTDGAASEKILVITAHKTTEGDNWETNCDAALEQWKGGFKSFNGKYPPVYNDASKKRTGDNPYTDPNAIALASLLQNKAQYVKCGTVKDCEDAAIHVLVCYFKPTDGLAGVPVDPMLWHALEARNKLKPELEKKENEEEKYSLKAVNAARDAVGLVAFNPVNQRKARVARNSGEPAENKLQEAVQTVLYTLTCDDILSSKISPAPSDEDFTVIYYIKDGAEAPTMAEAVKHWESGFEQLKFKRPPTFMKEVPQAKADAEAGDAAVEASTIYNDSAVAGYVSIMTDDPRTMACFLATGCEAPKSESSRADSDPNPKSGLICVVHTATLKEGEQPISKTTWKKIMRNKGYPMPEFKQLAASKNCLEEMNAVRTQEKLGLKPFLVKAAAAKSDTELVLSNVMESVTCQAIGGAAAKTTNSTGPEFKITDGTTSLMYHTGTENTCSEAVEAWKKGQEKFSAAPPAYTAAEEVYKDAAATNFVSLISDGESTTATCYSTGCTKDGIVCELSPAALVESKKPVSNETWTKYTEKNTETSGVAGVSKAALIGTVVMTLAAGVFFL